MFKKSLLSILLILSSALIFAQKTYFSDSTYIKDLQKFLSPSFKAKPELKQEFDEFAARWDSTELSDLHFGIVYASNLMRQKYAKPYPHFYNYLRTINKLVEAGKKDYYMEWEVGLMAVLEYGSMPKITNFLQVSADFICDSLLLKIGKTEWKAEAEEYSIVSDPDIGIHIDFNSPVKILLLNNLDTVEMNFQSGICYPLKKQWLGYEGKLTWKQAGLPEDEVFVNLPDTTKFDMKASKFTISNVLFTNSLLEFYKIKGEVNIKLRMSKQEQAPIFKAYDKMIVSPKDKALTVEGYFTMVGNKIYITEGKHETAKLLIYKNPDKKEIFIKALSPKIELTENSVTAPSSSVNINLKDRDSIYHINATIEYKTVFDSTIYPKNWFKKYGIVDFNRHFVSIHTFSKKNALVPFTDEYHNMDLYVSDLLWFVGGEQIFLIISYRTSLNQAFFQSKNYFNEKVYMALSGKGTDRVNHLAVLNKFYEDMQTRITLDEYVNKIREIYGFTYSKKIAREMCFKLELENFIDFIPSQDLIIIKPKVARYVAFYVHKREALNRNRKAGEDFDNLYLVSAPKSRKGIVGYIDLQTANLHIIKPKPFFLAYPQTEQIDDSLSRIYRNVLARPKEEVIVKKNLNMQFGGEIDAGLYIFKGPKFEFNYENYFVKIDADTGNVLNVSFALDTLGRKIQPITTQITGVSGYIYINDKDNKSGVFLKPEYPKVELDTAMVKYKNTDFSFDIYAFSQDSLNFLTQNKIKYKGTLVTNLLPDQKNTELAIRLKGKKGEKAELGFIKCKKIEGFPLGKSFNDTKAAFFGCIKLGDAGLTGKGILFYYNIAAIGDFVFAKDSLYSSKIEQIFINFDKLPEEIRQNIIAGTDTFDLSKNNYYKYLKLSHQSYSLQKMQQNFPLGYLNKAKTPIFIAYSQKNNSLDIVFNRFFSEYKRNKKRLKTSVDQFVLFPELNEHRPVFNGKLLITTKKIYAKGNFFFNEFTDKTNDNTIIHGDFVISKDKIYSKNFKTYFWIPNAFIADQLNADIKLDLKNAGGLGTFYSKELNRIVFERNKYQCKSDHFLWDIKQGLMDIGGKLHDSTTVKYANDIEEYKKMKKKDPGVKFFGALVLPYKSQGPVFSASYINYDVNQSLISCYKVPQIELRDARIIPGPSNVVKIKINAEFEPLNDLTVNFIDKFYKLDTTENGIDTTKQIITKYIFNEVQTLIIQDSVKYSAESGIYTYPYQNQRLKFTKIFYDPNQEQSYAECKSLEETKGIFKLDPYFDFRVPEGTNKTIVKIFRKEKYPFFSGYVFGTLIYQYKKEFGTYLFKITDNPVNFRHVVLTYNNIDQGKSYDMKINPKIYTGVFFDRKKGKKVKYSSLFLLKYPNDIRSLYYDETFKRNWENNVVSRQNLSKFEVFTLPEKNQITYDKTKGSYIISPDLVNADSMPVNSMAYNPELDIVKAKGRFEFYNYFSTLNPVFYGTLTDNKTTKKQRLSGVLILDNFPIPDLIKSKLLSDLSEVETSVFDKKRVYENYLILLGKNKVNEMWADISDYKVPEELSKGIVFNDVSFVWNSKYNGWESEGQIGIATIDGKKIDKYVDGKIYFIWAPTTKRAQIYIKINISQSKWYVFKYIIIDKFAQQILFNTSDQDLYNQVSQLKEGKRKINKFVLQPVKEVPIQQAEINE